MFSAEEAAQAFLLARRQSKPLWAFPGLLPSTMADAYEVQDRLINAWGESVAGWKVAAVRPEFRRAAGTSFLCGPIFQSTVRQSDPGSQTDVALLPGGFNAVEAELVFQVRNAVTPDEHTHPNALADLISQIRLGVELAGNALGGISDLGPEAVAAGFGNNLGLIVGPEVVKESLGGRRLRTLINGEVVGEIGLGAIEDRMPAFSALLGILAARGIALEAGAWVSTGALTGVHCIAEGDCFDVELEGYPAISGAAS